MVGSYTRRYLENWIFLTQKAARAKAYSRNYKEASVSGDEWPRQRVVGGKAWEPEKKDTSCKLIRHVLVIYCCATNYSTP